METRAHHVLIGLFTLLIVSAAIGFALWLGKSEADRQFKLYDIVFEEAVSGLSKGSTVEFNGIKIGEVSSLRLDPHNPAHVLARVRVAESAPIRTDTKARLMPAGITGISVIRLTSGRDVKSVPLSAPADEIPQIIASPSPLTELLADGEDIIVNVNELLVRARTLFAQENVEAIGHTLKNVDRLSGQLVEQREELGRALQQVAHAGEQAAVTLAEATRLMQTSRNLAEQDGRQTLEAARRSLAAFEQSMQNIDRLLAENRGQIDGGLRGLNEIGPTLIELRRALASLQTITRQMEDRPADYLLGREQIKEFQP
jgi:phospholipid/cholesterol/gamma-HCH transport system substrate-binding protein